MPTVDQIRLRIPGPTQVPERVLQAGTHPAIYHRGTEFSTLLDTVGFGLRAAYGTAGPVVVLSASGTGGLEASLVNLLRPGDRVLAVANGHWGRRYGRLATNLGARVNEIEAEWGTGFPTDKIEMALAQASYRAVLLAHNDTFTGAVGDLSTVAEVIRSHGALSLVDAVSSIGCMPIEMDASGVDVVIGASQKGLMSPPGLATVALSATARDALLEKPPTEYWDLNKALAMAEAGQTSFTPPTSLLFSLNEALAMIAEEGLPNVFNRHARMANALRAGAQVLGLMSFPDSTVASSSVVVLKVPTGLSASLLLSTLREQQGTLMAGARNSPLDGQIIRIGTMGACQPDDIRTDIDCLAQALKALGNSVDLVEAQAATDHILMMDLDSADLPVQPPQRGTL